MYFKIHCKNLFKKNLSIDVLGPVSLFDFRYLDIPVRVSPLSPHATRLDSLHQKGEGLFVVSPFNTFWSKTKPALL